MSPRLRIFIFCEGTNTEPDYLVRFAKEFGNRLVKVETVGGAGVPLTVVQCAKAKIRELRRSRDRFDGLDQVWAVFDCDEHPNIGRAMAEARQSGISVAYSNPCVELWAVLHFREHQAPVGRHELQKLLKQLMPSYDHQTAANFDYDAMAPGYDDALNRAARLRKSRHDEGQPYGCPYTDLDRLTDAIVKYGDPVRFGRKPKLI